MESDPLRHEPRADIRRDEHEWLPMASFVFVILALVALAVTPAVLLQRISRATGEITGTVLPANDRLRDLAFAMEARVSSSRSRFLTNDPRYDARLAEATAAEAAALRDLEALAPRLGAAASRRLESLQRHMDSRDSLEAVVLGAGGGLEAYRESLPEFDATRDSMLVQLTGLRQALMRVTRARAAEEARWAGIQRMISVTLGTVAVLAALLVGWFALRQRSLRREVQSALEEANRLRALAEWRGDELERATESRVRLLRGITHDVKNPLGAAKGYAELLEMGVKAPMLPEQAPLVQGVKRSVDGALAIIGDLLDLARADSGGLTVSRVQVDLREVVKAAVEDHRPAAEAAGHTAEVRLPAEPLTIYTDPARVGQVLGNLLTNATKYTPPPGWITVHAGAGSGGDAAHDGLWATVRVSDTGPGIPPEQREAIFDEFTRLEDGGAQKGHGLGLAIARRIARLLGGDLSVEDARGGGATFVLRLPIRETADAPVPGGEAETG